jgi:hypothetical protein
MVLNRHGYAATSQEVRRNKRCPSAMKTEKLISMRPVKMFSSIYYTQEQFITAAIKTANREYFWMSFPFVEKATSCMLLAAFEREYGGAGGI